MRTWPLTLALAACAAPDAIDPVDPVDSADTAPPCDPTQPTAALPDLTTPMTLGHLEVSPMAIDPESDNFPASHHALWWPDPSVPVRDELFVMLPGTSNTPAAFDEIAQIAARAGYPVAVLAWDSETHPGATCADLATDAAAFEACRTAVFEEKAYGTPSTDRSDIGEPDSVVGRLRRLIGKVDELRPELGADRWLDGDELAWDKFVVGGFSQGSLMAGYLTKDHAVARVVLWAGGCDAFTMGSGEVVLAAWCTAPRATPASRTFAARHVSDNPGEQVAIHDAYGIPGEDADADAASPAYCADTHRIATDLPSGGDGGPDRYHLSVAHDDFLHRDPDGRPTLAEDYAWLLTAPLAP